MKAPFLIGAVAKRPRPVRERPIRKALLRAISRMYDDSHRATTSGRERQSPLRHEMALIGVCHWLGRGLTDMGDDPMTTMKRAHLFGGPKRMCRAKERIERVQLLTASARERAMDLAQKYKDGNSTTHEGGDEHISHRR